MSVFVFVYLGIKANQINTFDAHLWRRAGVSELNWNQHEMACKALQSNFFLLMRLLKHVKYKRVIDSVMFNFNINLIST